MRKLTATSYAILGLLGLRSWSAYELTKQVRRSLHFCWPRAETRIYQEPKNLVEHGLVKATTTVKGRRPRTEYTITPKGRRALRAWMGEQSAPLRLESEALLRVFFAEHGTKEGLLATLAELEGQALALRRQAVVQGAEYLLGAAPFQERIHILGLVGRFTLNHTALVAEWARWAREEIERWPDVASGEVSPEVVQMFEAALAELTAGLPDKSPLPGEGRRPGEGTRAHVRRSAGR